MKRTNAHLYTTTLARLKVDWANAVEFRLGMDGWEKGVRHRNTGGEVERINNLDPV